MSDYRKSHAWEEIHLDRLEYNINNIRKKIGDDCKFMAIIKADAYGHGAVEVARHAIKCGVDCFGVACIDEAKQLRRNGIKLPVLILGATPLTAVEDLFLYDVMPTVFEETLPREISRYAQKTGKTLKIHIKIDTGMGRIGFLCYDNKNFTALDEIKRISMLPGIEIEGIFTHFSNADEKNSDTVTKKQFENFMFACDALKNAGVNIPVKHCANSAAIALYPNMKLDMVRAGIILYGEYPSRFVADKTDLKIKPVKEMKTTVSMVKKINKGSTVSYGQNYRAEKEETIATLAVGYADSYFRSLSGKARVIINGKFALQIGNICMDQMAVLASGIDDVKYGTEVTLVGKSGGKEITYSHIAELLGTINYEVMCDAGKRVVKAYFYNGEYLKSVNYLEKL